jgi:hypothetical protein
MGRRYLQPVRATLGARRDTPDHWVVPAEATIRRTLARLDADALAIAIGAWLANRDVPEPAGGGVPWRSTAERCAAPDMTATGSTC